MRDNIDASNAAAPTGGKRIGACGMVALFQLALTSAFFSGIACAGEAIRNLSYQNVQVSLKHVYLVRGPDAVNTSQTIRRLILSAIDLTAKIEACKAMSCTDGDVTEGMTVDIVGGPRLNYWVAVSSQRVQYSGTELPAALTVRTDAAGHLAGKLSFDNTAAGGPRVDAEFDAPLLKEFTLAR
jgi:hypothetical protein